MHPELRVWVDLYFTACAFEHQEFAFYQMAGAEGSDFEIFAHLRAKHREWEKEGSKSEPEGQTTYVLKR
jgi:hypothetical protein